MNNLQRTQSSRFVYILDLLFIIFIGSLLLAGILAPVFKKLGLVTQSEICYHFLAPTCHQLADRCFQLFNYPLGICSRCTGIYFGILLIRLFYQINSQGFCKFRYLFLNRLTTPLIFLSFISLTIFEWQFSQTGLFHSSNCSRFVSGIAFGIGWLSGPQFLIYRCMRRCTEKLLVQKGVLRYLMSK